MTCYSNIILLTIKMLTTFVTIKTKTTQILNESNVLLELKITNKSEIPWKHFHEC